MATPGTYKVTAQGGLWLREGPGTNTAELALMSEGATVDSDAQGSETNGFLHVFYGQLEGFASTKYLALQKPSVAAAVATAQVTPAAGPNFQITGQDVALRSGPMISTPDAYGPNSNVVTFTNKNEVARNDGQAQNGFALVTYKGTQGWMSQRYLQGSDLPLTPGQIIPATLAISAPPPTYVELEKGEGEPPVVTEAGLMKGGAVAPLLLLLAGVIYFLSK